MPSSSKIYHVAVEGIDFMGKTSLIRELQKRLTENNIYSITASLGGGRQLTIGEGVSEEDRDEVGELRYLAKNEICAKTRQEYFDKLYKIVNHKLSKLEVERHGKFTVVLWDRYTASAWAYAEAGGVITNKLIDMSNYLTDKIHLWVYLTPDLKLMKTRQKESGRSLDAVESSSDAFFNSVIDGFKYFLSERIGNISFTEVPPTNEVSKNVAHITEFMNRCGINREGIDRAEAECYNDSVE